VWFLIFSAFEESFIKLPFPAPTFSFTPKRTPPNIMTTEGANPRTGRRLSLTFASGKDIEEHGMDLKEEQQSERRKSTSIRRRSSVRRRSIVEIDKNGENVVKSRRVSTKLFAKPDTDKQKAIQVCGSL